MRRAVNWTVYLLIFVCTAYGQAQANLSIRAASSEPIEGWSKCWRNPYRTSGVFNLHCL
jgi:hypothetical protein